MAALDISIDGIKVATVNTDGFNVVSVNIGGTLIDDELASMNLSGGSYPEDGHPTYLTWVCDRPLHTGEHITVSFLKNGASSHSGKTIEELFPDEPPSTQTDFTPTTEMFEKLRAKPKQREKFSFRLVSSSGASFVGATMPDEHGFGFTVLWNSFDPEEARVSLHSYTLDSLETRGPMNNHVEERIHYGASVEFELVA